MRDLTPQEMAVIDHLSKAFNAHSGLPVIHDWMPREFMDAIHRAQHIVMSRPAQEVFNGENQKGRV